MKRAIIGGLLSIVLSSCAPSPRLMDYPDDATHFNYIRDNKRFHVWIADYKCEKPCKIYIDEFEKSDTEKNKWEISAQWILSNYGNKVPYEVRRITLADGKEYDLKERDLDSLAIPMDTLRARFYFK